VFGVRWTAPYCLRQAQEQLGADLTRFNGEESSTLPMPARYVISQDGVTAYAEVNPDYTRRPDPSDVSSVLDVQLAVRPCSYVRTAQVRTTTDCGIARDGGDPWTEAVSSRCLEGAAQ
jgi:hypothetical protein